MSVLGQRKANISYEQLSRLNSNSNSLIELKNLIKQDLGIYFTLKYYYSSLYKACFIDIKPVLLIKASLPKEVLKTY